MSKRDNLLCLNRAIYAGPEPEEMQRLEFEGFRRDDFRFPDPGWIVSEFEKGRGIDSLARDVRRIGIFRYQWQSEDYVRLCLLEAEKKRRASG